VWLEISCDVVLPLVAVDMTGLGSRSAPAAGLVVHISAEMADQCWYCSAQAVS
jgi:hypothetical protein